MAHSAKRYGHPGMNPGQAKRRKTQILPAGDEPGVGEKTFSRRDAGNC